MNNDGFSIIVPTYNRAELLRVALESIQALRVPEGWQAEVLVIDNNCTDHSADVIEEAAKSGPLHVRHIVEARQGLNHGRNRGLSEARFEHLVYLDDDMRVDPGWLEGYVEARELLGADCIVGPVEPWFEGEIPGWVNPRVLDSVTSAYSRKGASMSLLDSEQGHEVPGCNFGVRKSVAVEAGGFHPLLDRSGRHMLAGGDWEFGAKLVSRDERIVYAPRCRISHFISEAKLSKDGLRKRWAGLGATQRTLMALRGERPPFARQPRLFLRMIRFLLRSIRLRLCGDRPAALLWELEARRLQGFLLARPSSSVAGPRKPAGHSKARPLGQAPRSDSVA